MPLTELSSQCSRHFYLRSHHHLAQTEHMNPRQLGIFDLSSLSTVFIYTLLPLPGSSETTLEIIS